MAVLAGDILSEEEKGDVVAMPLHDVVGRTDVKGHYHNVYENRPRSDIGCHARNHRIQRGGGNY